MINRLWGDWSDGRIGQRDYAIAYGLTFLAFLAIILGIGLAAGIAEAFFGSWVDHFEAGQGRGWALAALIGFFFVMLAIGLAQLNLSIKRGRDAGLPGWLVAVAYLALMGMGGALVGAILLALIPPGQFAKSA